jgi:hypothetical protein
MKLACFLALPALGGAAALVLAAPAAADDYSMPLELIIQNNMPVPVYTDTQTGASQCLRGLPGTTVPARGVVYVTMWVTCPGKPMSGQQVFIPSVAGSEVRTSVGFGLNEEATDLAGGSGASAALSVSVSGFGVDVTTVPAVGTFGVDQVVSKVRWKWTIDCPAAGCPKP